MRVAQRRIEFVAALGSLDREIHLDVSSRRVGVGADLLMSFARQDLEFFLWETRIHHEKLDREAKSAGGPQADRRATGHRCTFCVLLFLRGNVIERAAKAGSEPLQRKRALRAMRVRTT